MLSPRARRPGSWASLCPKSPTPATPDVAPLQLVCFYFVFTTFTTVGYGEIRFCPCCLCSIVHSLRRSQLRRRKMRQATSPRIPTERGSAPLLLPAVQNAHPEERKIPKGPFHMGLKVSRPIFPLPRRSHIAPTSHPCTSTPRRRYAAPWCLKIIAPVWHPRPAHSKFPVGRGNRLPGQVYCIFLFLAAASLFGTLISQASARISSAAINEVRGLEGAARLSASVRSAGQRNRRRFSDHDQGARRHTGGVFGSDPTVRGRAGCTAADSRTAD